MPRYTGYQAIFHEAVPNISPPLIEGLVRACFHPTLDHLTRAELTRLGKRAAKLYDIYGDETAKNIARSIGGYHEGKV